MRTILNRIKGNADSVCESSTLGADGAVSGYNLNGWMRMLKETEASKSWTKADILRRSFAWPDH